MLWFKKKPHAPTDLELELIESLEAVTACVEDHNICGPVADEGRAALEHAKAELGVIERSGRTEPSARGAA